MVSIDCLVKAIDSTQLTSDFEGTFNYDHKQWLDSRIVSSFELSPLKLTLMIQLCPICYYYNCKQKAKFWRGEEIIQWSFIIGYYFKECKALCILLYELNLFSCENRFFLSLELALFTLSNLEAVLIWSGTATRLNGLTHLETLLCSRVRAEREE